METGVKTFDKVSVYHSKLVQASADRLAVQFGSVRESKFKKGTFTIAMKVYGEEDTTYWYQIENDTIKKDLESLPRNEKGDTDWLSIRAEGSRDQAIISVEDVDGQLVNRALPPTIPGPRDSMGNAPHKPAGPPSNLWEGTDISGLADEPAMTATQRVQEASFSDPLAARYLASLEAAKLAVDEYRKRHGSEPSETVRNIATTIFIQNGRH